MPNAEISPSLARIRIGTSPVAQLPVFFGGSWYMPYAGPSAQDDGFLAAMQAAYDFGIRHFDTAATYGKGHSETLYGRFLLHAITRMQQDAFLECAARELQKGDTLAFEFRTDQDEPLKKKKPFSGRRFIRPEAIERRMAELGFRLLVREEGTGFSPHLGEDPHLCRLIFVKTAKEPSGV